MLVAPGMIHVILAAESASLPRRRRFSESDMPRRTPITHEMRWHVFGAHTLAFGAILLLTDELLPEGFGVYFIIGAFATYIILSREIFARHHRRGIRHVRARRWSEAVDCSAPATRSSRITSG